MWAQRKIRVRPGLASKRNFEALVRDWGCLAEVLLYAGSKRKMGETQGYRAGQWCGGDQNHKSTGGGGEYETCGKLPDSQIVSHLAHGGRDTNGRN